MSTVAWQLGGGIGSGKSTVRRMLQELGVHAIDADSIGHDVIAPDGPAFGAVAERWPEVVADGRIDRAALATVVFRDPAELRELEAMTHPHIFGRIATRLQDLSGVVVVEIPLLDGPAFESMPRLVVDCSDDIRLSRLIDRGMTPEDARARMATQPGRDAWLAAADLVIPNHGDLDTLRGVAMRALPLLRVGATA